MAPKAKGPKGFDTKLFDKTKFHYRTTDIPVPGLKDFFPEGEDPVWTVRNMDANEIMKCTEAKKTLAAIDATFQASAGALVDEGKLKEMREVLGIEEDIHHDILFRRMELVFGSIKPEIDHAFAVKLSNSFSTEFLEITSEIYRLTGLGKTPGKPKPSGKKTT